MMDFIVGSLNGGCVKVDGAIRKCQRRLQPGRIGLLSCLSFGALNFAYVDGLIFSIYNLGAGDASELK